MKLRALGRYIPMGGNADYEYEWVTWNPIYEKELKKIILYSCKGLIICKECLKNIRGEGIC